MDTNNSQNPQPIIPANPTNTTDELTHTTEEMYKKNLELAEKNKTLSILRKIDEIIFSKVTDIRHISQQVANIVAIDAEFKGIAIYLVDKTDPVLNCVAISETPLMQKISSAINRPFYNSKIYLTEKSNFIASAVWEKKMRISHDGSDIVSPYFSEQEVKKVKDIDEIASSLIYPLIIRDTAIGAIIINLGEQEKTLFQYQKELFDRLVGVISIALDNALLYQKIQEANEHLQMLDKLKDEFVSLASHELRTPLGGIKLYMWSLANEDQGPLNEKQKIYVNRIYEETLRLLSLVNDMLDLSRIEGGRMTINQDSQDLLALVTDTLTTLTPQAEKNKLSLTVEPPQTTLPGVFIDKNKIKQVFLNLIGNSLKFTPEGGKVTISFEQKDQMILTSITDTGRGIKAEDMEKLFKKFNKLEERKEHEGTGLGLYITKSIIELHGGKITASSEGENKGTTFSFTLPVANQPERK